MTDKQIKTAELKVIRVLQYWEDADIFSLTTKKRIAEMVVAELQDLFRHERGL
jgi:hypothetical protein